MSAAEGFVMVRRAAVFLVAMSAFALLGCTALGGHRQTTGVSPPDPSSAQPPQTSNAPNASNPAGLNIVRTVTVTVESTPAAPPLAAVRFVDARHGWAAGKGVILATDDGGRSWKRQYSGPATVTALEFVDPLRGWAVGEDDLLRTTDGGARWRPVAHPAPGNPQRTVDFINATDGWALAGDKLFGTGDGGATWTELRTPGPVESICLAGPTVGWAAGRSKVWLTANGGTTWKTALAAPIEGAWPGTVRCRGSAAWVLFRGGVGMSQEAYVAFHTADGGERWEPMLAAGYFSSAYPTVRVQAGIDAYAGPFDVVDAATAIFLGTCPACGMGSVSITATGDSGRTWQKQTIAGLRGGGPYAISFVDAQRGWLAAARGGQGEILATTDGGRTWRRQYPSADLTPSLDVDFVNDRLGYGLGIIGDPAAVLRTTDGGKRWEVIATLPGRRSGEVEQSPAFSLSFVDPQRGWAITPDGRVMKTSDGGRRWEEVVPPVSGRELHFASSRAGCAGGWSGKYLGTTDGGSNWQAVDRTGGVRACAARLASRRWEAALRTLGEEAGGRGWALLDFAGEDEAWVDWVDQGWLATRDGGRTWTRQKWPDTGDRMQSVSFVNGGKGWMLTTGGWLLHTTDGGATWTQLRQADRP